MKDSELMALRERWMTPYFLGGVRTIDCPTDTEGLALLDEIASLRERLERAEADRDTYSREAGIFAAEAQVWEQKCAAAEAALEEARGTIRKVVACEHCSEDYGRCMACDRALAAALSPGAAPK